jgi:hypothetical protein
MRKKTLTALLRRVSLSLNTPSTLAPLSHLGVVGFVLEIVGISAVIPFLIHLIITLIQIARDRKGRCHIGNDP